LKLQRLIAINLVPLLSVGFFVASARATPNDVDACADASESGQKLRDEGHFRAARAVLLTCTREGCPAIVARDCVAFLAELDARTPSIVVRATRASGDDISNFTLTIDSDETPNASSGRAISVDPGLHRLRFAAPGEVSVERTVLVRERELHRDVSVTFPAAVAKTRPESVDAPMSRTRFTTPVVALGATGIVALIVGGALGIKGFADRNGYDACKPNCDSSAVDATKRLVVVADVTCGLGLAATALATALFLSGTGDTPKQGTAAIGVGPGSFTAGWSGRF
jgi:hypothetical protein